MDNMELIDKAWKLREQGVISLHEHDLYSYLLHRCGEIGQNPFSQSSGVLCAVLGINRNALADRRNKLSALGLITFKDGVSKLKPAQYYVCKAPRSQVANQSKRKVTDHPSTSFAIPTLADVITYCAERNNGINPQAFFDFYQSKDWFVGKNKMKDWQAAVRTWEMNKKEEKRIMPKHDNNITYVQF
ncbi:hypothetical protein [Dysgonomonas sp. ZJ709]|uniref:hypothetical protein n=1 Tax=Dysgonomonas sp. ZJ709 TaxID=2709797 RepID=UPI0013EBC929|nr:hypothetical protein [Dysgonomonas sp. ZJ709]